MARAIGSMVGGVGGFVTGGPMGAMAGATIGGEIGGAIGSNSRGGGGTGKSNSSLSRVAQSPELSGYLTKANKHESLVQQETQSRVADLSASEASVNRGVARENKARRPSGIFTQGAQTRNTQEFSIGNRPRRRGGVFNEGTSQQQPAGQRLG